MPPGVSSAQPGARRYVVEYGWSRDDYHTRLLTYKCRHMRRGDERTSSARRAPDLYVHKMRTIQRSNGRPLMDVDRGSSLRGPHKTGCPAAVRFTPGGRSRGTRCGGVDDLPTRWHQHWRRCSGVGRPRSVCLERSVRRFVRPQTVGGASRSCR
jgi:hypothetical protein